jgi:arabinose-5-phosphate isomerase
MPSKPHSTLSTSKPAGEIAPRQASAPAEIALASEVLREEGQSLLDLASSIAGPSRDAFMRAVEVLTHCAETGGTVLVTGLGKSGLIGAKISATLASLGIPSHSVHPSEAAHGDLGRFRPVDTVVALSFSGETDEVVNLAAVLNQDKLPIVAMVGGTPDATATASPSSLERLALVTLRIGVTQEAGNGRFSAPTTSTTAMLALGDALALAVAQRRNFTDEDFAKRHPGGSLGELLRPITEILRFRVAEGPLSTGNVPLIDDHVSVREALTRAASIERRPGALLLIDARTGRLTGIFTDGDLRRLILRSPAELDRPIHEVMTRTPRTIPSSALVRDAVRLIRERRQDEIPVVDEAGRPVGILDVQDLIAMRLVRE